jgi:uncharacterized Tic20 family protein
MNSTFNEKQWTLLAHLSGFLGFVFPLGNVIGPLLVWFMKKEQSALVEMHAREAVNFQLSITIYYIAALVLSLVLVGFVLLGALAIFQVVVMIIAALQADKGMLYRYPLSIRFINGQAT